MAADRRSDGVNLHFAVQLRESGLNQIRDCAGVLVAGGMGDVAFAGVIRAVIRTLFHPGDNRLDHLLLRADLLTGDQLSQAVHIQQRADVKNCADEAGRLADAAAADIFLIKQ